MYTAQDPRLSATVNRLRREVNATEARKWAKDLGFEVRWDRDGNLYIRDLLAEEN